MMVYGSLVPRFDREFFDAKNTFTRIGSGALGGKASGLLRVREEILSRLDPEEFPYIEVAVPTATVLTTELFDSFIQRNRLEDIAGSDLPDDRIAHAFQQAELPAEHVGDLRGLISSVHAPLAVRSSSLLEDDLDHPFAGVYGTKMVPNNEIEEDARFNRLMEAVKFVYATTFFAEAKAYLASISRHPGAEKMAAIVQEVVGQRTGDRFYPCVSGVARSHNYYPTGHAKAEDGVVTLALGLGKTIVDGGLSWSYSPAFPKAPPPFNDLLKRLMELSVHALGGPVEIELAVNLDRQDALPARVGFLQVRPMMVGGEHIDVAENNLYADDVVLASENVLGNGRRSDLEDVVLIRPDAFEPAETPAIAKELEGINRRLVADGRRYLLIGFGRWGTSDSSFDIPIAWGQISGARAIVEATLPDVQPDLSQGSHFFHNLLSFRVLYLSVEHHGPHRIDWDWLDRQPVVQSTARVTHIRLPTPLDIRVDGADGRGVIRRHG